VRQSYNVACPAAITTGTWDCHVMSLPFSKSVHLATNVQQGGTDGVPTNEFYRQSTGVNLTLGGLNIVSQATGTGFNPSVNLPSSTNVWTPESIPDSYLEGNARVIGKGFEIHNTTSDLNRQGMITTWSVPVPDLSTSGFAVNGLDTGGSFSLLGFASVLPIPMWPVSQSAAVNIPGSRQWTAEQGAYMVNRYDPSRVLASSNGYMVQPFINAGDLTAATNIAGTPSVSSIDSGNLSFPNVFWEAFDMRGVLLSGLSLQTTLTINIMWIIERQPDPTITDLIVMVKEPPERDNVALDLYTHISDHLPTGVPVGENGLGDWFMDALSTAADFVAPVLSAVPVVGGALSAGVQGLNTLYKNHKAEYETNPYAAVSTKEISGVYNSAASAVRQFQKNRSKGSAPKEVVIVQKGKGGGGGRMIGPQTEKQAVKTEKKAIKRALRKERRRIGPRRINGAF